MIYQIQNAVRQNDFEKYKKYSQYLNDIALKTPTSLRHTWKIKSDRKSIQMSEVEPAREIVKRFKIGPCHLDHCHKRLTNVLLKL